MFLSNIFIFFLLFSIGAVLGSFLNVLIDRLSTGRNFAKGRSYCEHCKKTLKTIDLIPVVSFLLLLGKCRFCKTKIPLRLFVVEVLCGALFSYLYIYALQMSINIFLVPLLFIILWSYIGIFFADFEYGIIPDLLVGISITVGILYVFFVGQPVLNHLLAGFGAFAFFILLFLVTKGKGMGLGDVKLSFSLGLFLGFPLIVVSLYTAFLTGASVAIILVIWKKIRFFGGTIPFGPFLIFGTFFALFLGNTITTYILKSYF